VRIVIDKAGNVTEARALSGPMLLRDAAVSALRQRKYAPSKLDGRPISVEMLVTIQFRR
jgi:protein TonB